MSHKKPDIKTLILNKNYKKIREFFMLYPDEANQEIFDFSIQHSTLEITKMIDTYAKDLDYNRLLISSDYETNKFLIEHPLQKMEETQNKNQQLEQLLKDMEGICPIPNPDEKLYLSTVLRHNNYMNIKFACIELWHIAKAIELKRDDLVKLFIKYNKGNWDDLYLLFKKLKYTYGYEFIKNNISVKFRREIGIQNFNEWYIPY